MIDIDVTQFHWETGSGVIITKWDNPGETCACRTIIALYNDEVEELVRLLRDMGYLAEWL